MPAESHCERDLDLDLSLVLSLAMMFVQVFLKCQCAIFCFERLKRLDFILFVGDVLLFFGGGCFVSLFERHFALKRERLGAISALQTCHP